jgi:4'-phosphopantetheinyl transferase
MCYETIRFAETALSLTLASISPFRPLLTACLTAAENEYAAFDMAIKPLLSMITNVTEINNGYPTPAQSPTEGEVTCWILDTRKLWPGDNILTAKGAAEAMSLVSIKEQNVIRGKMFVQDARMSLGSALLKRAYISQALGIKWRDVRIGKKGHAKYGKPCAVDAVDRPIAGIDFNLSHQGGLVVLIGYNGGQSHEFTPSGMVYGMISPTTNIEEVTAAVDIVCVGERNDWNSIDQDGFDGWVDIYDSVFSDEERWTMKYDVDYITLLDGTILHRDDIGRHDRCISRNKDISLTTPAGRDYEFNSDRILEAKLRRFYTYFCYKEAYIKLSGEALLAPWLKQLEFFNVRSPQPGSPARCSTHGVWGEEVDDVTVMLNGLSVPDVAMKMQSFEENFMISTAIQGDIQGLKIPAFKMLDLEADVLANSPLRSLAPKMTHKRVVSEPPPYMKTGEHLLTSPLVHVRDSPNVNDNPYLYAREVPLCLM